MSLKIIDLRLQLHIPLQFNITAAYPFNITAAYPFNITAAYPGGPWVKTLTGGDREILV